MLSRVLLLSAALLLLSASTAAAQRINTIKPTAPTAASAVTLEGFVRDAEGRPLAAAEVIVDADHRAITNSEGHFRIPGVTAGLIEFSTRRIGYQPVTTGIQVEPGLTVQLAVKLVPAAIDIGTMVIEGKAVDKSLWQTGFYDRQKSGVGHYFDSEYMKRYRMGLGTLLETVPSIMVERGQAGRGSPVPMGRSPNGGRCPMSVFVDGNFLPWANTTGLDFVVNRDDVLAVEVYPRASQMPNRIVGRGGASGMGGIGAVTLQGASLSTGSGFMECGAILIWTKPLGETK